MTSPRCTRRRDEQGSVSAWAATITVAVLLMIGLAVDGGGYLAARSRAADVAAEAARSGAQQVSNGALRGGDMSVDPSRAVQAANTYAANAGMRSTTTLGPDGVVRVTVITSYEPVLLGSMGVGSLSVEATEEAQPRWAG